VTVSNGFILAGLDSVTGSCKDGDIYQICKRKEFLKKTEQVSALQEGLVLVELIIEHNNKKKNSVVLVR
jgi:hypothetical protein